MGPNDIARGVEDLRREYEQALQTISCLRRELDDARRESQRLESERDLAYERLDAMRAEVRDLVDRYKVGQR